MTDESSAGSEGPTDDYVREQVADALELASYVVSNGIKDSDGQLLSLGDVETIHTTAALLGMIKIKSEPGTAPNTVSTPQWIAFEGAYYRLAALLHPVTAETLRATKDIARRGEGGFFRRILDKLRNCSPAQHFNNKLWFWTIVLALFVVFAEWGVNILGLKADQTNFWVKGPRDLLQSLQPWAYGGLGACAYMLRSAHYFIYSRSFDVRRTPEYANRILLGAISGGAIILFVNNLANDDGSAINLGSAALGFVAGYSTDFLFNTIERVVTAIFPKVAVETVPADSSMARTPPKHKPPPGGKTDPASPPPAPGGDDKDDKSKGKGRSRAPPPANVSGAGEGAGT